MKAYDKNNGKSNFIILFDGKGKIPKKMRKSFKKAARQSSKKLINVVLSNYNMV